MPVRCRSLVLGLLALLAFVPAGRGFAQEATPEADIAALVKQLGDAQFDVREQAMRKLIEIGKPALPALEKAAESRDAETAFRAKRAIRAITYLEPAEQEELRREGEAALHAGDKQAMLRVFRRLGGAANATFRDRCWLAHVSQLVGDWEAAATAYAAALAMLEKEVDELGDAPVPPPPVLGGVPVEPSASREALLRPRAPMILMLGRIQRHLLDDPAAAAETYSQVAKYSEVLQEPIDKLTSKWLDHTAALLEARKEGRRAPREARPAGDLYTPMLTLRELADTQEQLGKYDAALATWRRIRLTSILYLGNHNTDGLIAIDRILRKYTAKPGDTPIGVVQLTAEEPSLAFELDDPATLAKSARQDNDYWTYCLSPPAGMEFAELTFDCDLEQLERRYGGQFECWTMVGDDEPKRINLGGIGWPNDQELGRAIQARKYSLEPGVGAVYFKAGTWPEKFRVHKVQATAKLRPRATDASSQPTPGYTIQNQCLPDGGALTLDGEPYYVNAASHDVKPGKHVYRYTHPTTSRGWTFEADFQPGARYGLFINLDSPLESKLTDLRGLAAEQCSLVRRKDGAWLLAWETSGGAIRFAESKDLLHWSQPWQAPESALFGDPIHCTGPSLYRDTDGTLHLAYFSNRLDLDHGGYCLFLMHSKDGRNWSTPRPLKLNVSGTPLEPAQMMRSPQGMFCVFHRLQLGTAESPEKISEFVQLDIAGEDSLPSHARNAQATFAADGGVHLVWDHFGQKLMYSRRSRDGDWSAAREITNMGESIRAARPRLIVDGERSLLCYEQSPGASIAALRLPDEGELRAASPLKITDHVAPLCCVLSSSDDDGRITVLCGSDTVWMRSASRGELFKTLFPDKSP